MKTKDWLAAGTRQLKAAGIGTARLDCLVLLGDCLNKNQAQVLAEPDRDLTIEQQNWLQRRLLCRVDHEPLAYIRGKTEFYGRDFLVTPAVLEPRPESETMIELAKRLPVPETIIDLGTGSGALGVTAALEIAPKELMLTDIDPACLAVAKQNTVKYRVKAKFIKADLLNDIEVNPGTLILANLPYVPNDYKINKAALLEPRQAIFGGPDGLDLYRRLFKQSKAGNILTESLPFQHIELRKIAKLNNYSEIAEDDFIQVFSCLAQLSK